MRRPHHVSPCCQLMQPYRSTWQAHRGTVSVAQIMMYRFRFVAGLVAVAVALFCSVARAENLASESNPNTAAEAPATQPSPAEPAAPIDEDLVELNNGGFVTGRLVEYLPGSHLAIRTSSGKTLRFEMAQVRRVRRHGQDLPLNGDCGDQGCGAAESAEAPPAKNTNLEKIWEGIAGPRVTLAVSANRDGTLQRRIGSYATEDKSAYHLVCRLPCVVDVPKADSAPYRISGDEMQPTSWFSVPQANATVRAKLESESWRLAPRALLLLGGVTSLIGTTVFVLNRTSVLDGDGWKWTSVGISAVTGTLLATGLGLWLFGPHSTVDMALQ